jgi:Cft2 family RNA processing exonuclease
LDIGFEILGGGEEIGANSYILRIDTENIVLDCGLHPRKKGMEIFPDYKSVKDETINHLIISHAHNDHIGALPYYLKLFPYSKIYTTKPTLSIADVTLLNTSSIIRKEFLNEWDKSVLEYYTDEILNLIPMIIKQQDYRKEIKLTNELTFEFFDAGHILGSASVLIKACDKKIFYTGDINMRQQSLIPPAELPKGKVDILILESTNGEEATLPSYDEEEKRLAKFINEISGDGGSVLVPVFALGKAQEMLKRIDGLMEKNKIPHMPVYVSPMSKLINKVYDRYNYTVRRIEDGMKLSQIKTIELRREYVEKGEFYKHPSVVLATSGMMIERTMSFRLAKRFLQRKNFGIAVCGYCDPDTPGFKIKYAKRFNKIYFNYLDSGTDVYCRIENFKFTAHSDRGGLLKIVEKLKPEKIILLHGSENAISEMGKEIVTRFKGVKVLVPEKGKKYNLFPDLTS